MKQNFHISLPCLHISATKNFYENILSARIGRSALNWIDIDLYGNQLTFTKSGKYKFDYPNYSFEKTILPSFHFGIILPIENWNEIRNKIEIDAKFHIPVTTFLSDKSGEHRSFFIQDPNGYIIEFKCFKNQGDTFKF